MIPPRQSIAAEACTRCGLCAAICPSRIFEQTEDAVCIQPEYAEICLACGHCVAVCPTGALSVDGVQPAAPEVPASAASADDLMALMLRRRSTRAFADEPVGRDLLAKIVAAAGTAPMCFPPTVVEVTVLGSREQVEPIVPATMAQLAMLQRMMGSGFGRFVLRLMAGKKVVRLLSEYLMPLARPWLDKWKIEEEDYVTWGAPALLLFHSAGDSPVGETDALIASTQAMLMAEALGLGSVMLGFASSAVDRDKTLRRRYGLPDGHRVWNTLAVGHAQYKFQRTIVRDLKNVTWV